MDNTWRPITVLPDPPRPITGGRCEACNKELGDHEQGITGYASGEELGLCGGCASWVNTQENIEEADRALTRREYENELDSACQEGI